MIDVRGMVVREAEFRRQQALRTIDPTLPLILPYDEFGHEYDGDLFTNTKESN